MEKTDFEKYKKSRLLVIIEATLEYFIAISVTTTFLTAILNEMGISASLQGIINAITSLACTAQLVAVFTVKKSFPCKRWISILSLISQLLFALLYCVPSVKLETHVKVVIFIGILTAAYLLQHFLTPSRTQWQMALVEDGKRGIFTANKEIVSLIGGMLFSQGAGILLDYLKSKGEINLFFIVMGVTVTALAISHLVVILATGEPEEDTDLAQDRKKFGEIIKTVFGSAALRRLIIFDALFAVACASIYFYPAYMTQTVGVSYTYLTTVGIICSLFRALISRRLGRLADKRSWIYMMSICIAVLAAGFALSAFCTVSIGIFIYPVYSLCYYFSLGGTNSGRVNLFLDYVSHSDRRYILGVKSAISGVIEFAVTILLSIFLSAAEKNGGILFGLPLHPQQILFAASAIILLLLIIFYIPILKKQKINR